MSRAFVRLLTASSLLALSAALPPAASGAVTALAQAVRDGDRAAVRELLKDPARANETEPDGTTPLHWAAESDDIEIVRLLLAAGARPDVASRTGVTPLALAALNGSAASIAALLDAGADPDVRLSGGQTALMTAARAGRAGAVRALLEHGADVHAREDVLGETALAWAAAENHAEVVRLLAAHGADVDVRSNELRFPQREFGDGKSGRLTVLPAGGWTPLMYAARQNAAAAAEALVDAGAALDLTDPDGTSALIVAVINAHYELAALLLERGADPDVADVTGMTALYAAVDMNTFTETPGRPAPVPSGVMDAPAMVRALLAHGADPDARLSSPILVRVHDRGDASLGDGATALMRAARKADVELMRLLLDGGADPRLAMANGGTALMFAAGLGGAGRFTEFEERQATEADRLEAVRLLAGAGADVHAVNEAGQSALHLAAAERGEEVVRFLAGRGARLDLRDSQGRTPLDVAAGVGARGRGGRAPARPAIADLLRTLMTERGVP